MTKFNLYFTNQVTQIFRKLKTFTKRIILVALKFVRLRLRFHYELRHNFALLFVLKLVRYDFVMETLVIHFILKLYFSTQNCLDSLKKTHKRNMEKIIANTLSYVFHSTTKISFLALRYKRTKLSRTKFQSPPINLVTFVRQIIWSIFRISSISLILVLHIVHGVPLLSGVQIGSFYRASSTFQYYWKYTL